ncbi:MAG TPA: hypothetical protein VIG68_01070 [Lysobacter sp.]
MNTVRIARVCALALLCAGSFAVSAQTVGVSVQAGGAEPLQDEAVNPGDRPATHPFCLRSTGSMIAPRSRPLSASAASRASRPSCIPAAGRVYTRHDLDSTGAVDIADALRRLDPSIR